MDTNGLMKALDCYWALITIGLIALVCIAGFVVRNIKSNSKYKGNKYAKIYDTMNDAMTNGMSLQIVYDSENGPVKINECVIVGDNNENYTVYAIVADGDKLKCHIIDVREITYIKENDDAVEVI